MGAAQLGSAESGWQPAGGALSTELHERQQGLFGSSSQADVGFHITPGSLWLRTQPLRGTAIEHSLSSLSLMIATMESGRKNAARCASNTSSTIGMPSVCRSTTSPLPWLTSPRGGNGSIK